MMTPKSGINNVGKSYFYYQCTRNSHLGNQACRAKYLPADAIENFIIERVKELITNQDEINKMIEKANELGDKNIKNLNNDKQSLQKQVQDVKFKMENIANSIESGDVKVFKSLNKRIESLEKERNELESKLKSIDFEISKIQQEKLSKEIMSQTFSSFREIIDKARPQKLKGLLFKIVEVVEWNEDEKDGSSGHCKISYFEQPHLVMPKSELSPP